ncbi:superoxide dismutase [Ni] [Aeoliella mucimassa]|uniref:Nickel-containing superoxide dismutase n=1 Tax=Aeoliella mucimassa TaxID=2527972 RepID=A0A518AGT4_9BACT|nr:superoxide dismutase [Ni] [Aeoliella mucimassa]QDU53938.1 Nickel-containing superoxide dismutase [Aeoliella mucimassa]
MKTRFMLFAAALIMSLPTAGRVLAHCQVPCGIYGDERRFEEMLEDTQTIAKAITQIKELSGTHDANGHNQLARWVSTKEAHASNIQEIIGQYFLAQRIKSDKENYVDQLKAAHGVIVAAMKCKQSAEPATAKALEEAIHDLYRAYEGKEPVLGEAEHAATHAVTTAVEAAHEAHAEHSHEAGHDHEHAAH